MNFKAYDILSSLIPGFLALLFLLKAFEMTFDKDFVIAYTAIAFLLGFIMNTISSWMEDFYFFTWGGKPSTRLLDGKGIWKVKFYSASKAKVLLQKAMFIPIAETQIGAPDSTNNPETNSSASNDELFMNAMRYVNGEKDTRVDDFNAMYAFSRSLLTTVLIGTIVLLFDNYQDWKYYAILIPSSFVLWLRCKQRAYYYAREILHVYLKLNKS